MKIAFSYARYIRTARYNSVAWSVGGPCVGPQRQRPTRQPSTYTYGVPCTALHQTRYHHPSIYLALHASAGAGQVQAPVQTQCRRAPDRGAPREVERGAALAAEP